MRLKTLWKYVIPFLIILVAILFFLINSGQFPLLDINKSVSYPAPIYEASYNIILNQDKTITYRFYTAKLESIEVKKFLLSDYVLLTLRPVTGDGPVNKTYQLALPSNLKALGTTTSPQDLKNSLDKTVSLGITYNQKKASYSFSDVASWSLFDVF